MWSKIKVNPVYPLILCFIFLNIFSRGDGATNEKSRYATLRAMAQEGTFKINNYKSWTIDWSYKDGNYFSNKAPGPMLLGFPVFFIIDYFAKFDRKQKFNEKGLKVGTITATPRAIMAIFCQILPLALICFFIAQWLIKSNNDPNAVIFFILATLFGNSISIFMNFLFGHGMAGIFALGTSYFLLKKDFFKIGLFFGLTLLTEYTAGLLLFPLVITIIFFDKKNFSWVKPFILGGIFPGILWVWYHTATTGSPFSVPAQFQNPLWISKTASGGERLWGLFAIPDFNIFLKLLFGGERGILFTQPWVLVLLPLIPYSFFKTDDQKFKGLGLFCGMSLLLLLIMNSSFNGWHGGATSGPRYLSMIFPSFALFGALSFKHIKNLFYKWILGIGLFISLAFRALVYGGRALAPEGYDLWPWLWKDLLSKDGMKGEMKAILLIVLIIVAIFLSFRNFSPLKTQE